VQTFDVGKKGEISLDPKDTTDWFVCDDSGVLTVPPLPQFPFSRTCMFWRNVLTVDSQWEEEYSGSSGALLSY
jgi:hypothetical protein